MSCWSFSATLAESRLSPDSAPRNSSGVLRVRSARVVSDSASWSVSIWSDVEARPSKASTTSNGEEVRSAGIVPSSSSWPPPAGSRARNIAPRIVFTLIAARVSEPNLAASSTLKLTLTWPSSSAISSTFPTRTPAIRTSSFFLRPPASVNIAW